MRTTGSYQGYTVSVFFFNRKTKPSQDWLEQVFLINHKLDILWPSVRLGCCCVKQHCGNVLGILFLHLLAVTSFSGKLGQNSSPKTVPQHWTGVNPDIKQIFYLWHGPLIMLYKVVLTFESMDVVLKCDHATKRYRGSFCCTRLFKSFTATFKLK